MKLTYKELRIIKNAMYQNTRLVECVETGMSTDFIKLQEKINTEIKKADNIIKKTVKSSK